MNSLGLSNACVLLNKSSAQRTKGFSWRPTRKVRLNPHASMKMTYHQLQVPTKLGISLHDITPQIKSLLEEAGISNGFVNVLSRHTTTAITINECEQRLIDDVRQYLPKVAPPNYPYLHNDIHLRSGPEDWPGGDEAWRAQEPQNAHSHLLSMLVGNSESIPVVDGNLTIGTWQSVILLELDGPRNRTVGVQVIGE
mmetsp:Transcript_16994/g.32555  ORF Transcript_16994/g.32555 Transcript_16994/m.32555 type:complete len:196 (-) Transcript_16994:203-790(-)